jgi:chromosome segregation ATPase
MKTFSDLILETATAEEIALAGENIRKKFKNPDRISQNIMQSLLADEVRKLRMERNREKIRRKLSNEYGINPRQGELISEKLEKAKELYFRLDSEIASLSFQIKIGADDKERLQRELDILESKLERAKKLWKALENAEFHYRGLVEQLMTAIQEEIELEELYP